MNTLVNALNEQQREQIGLSPAEESFAKFSYIGGRIHISFPDEGVSLLFSPDLAQMLGLESDVLYSVNTTAQKSTSMIGDIHSVYVYCDLLEHVAVGDTKAPLLRIVDKPARDHGNVHQIFNPTLYVPLQKKNFDTVEINIMTDTGLPVPFLPGKSFVVLDFRRAVHPHFAI